MHLEILRKAALTLLYGRGLAPHFAPADATIRARAAIDGLSGCVTLSSFLDACESLTPTFDSLPLTQKVACYCYDSKNTFLPAPFNNAASSCYSYLSSVIPSDAVIASSLVGLCTKYASSVPATTSYVSTSLATSPSTFPGTVTLIPVISKAAISSPSGNNNLKSCSTAIALATSCAAAIPSFTNLAPVLQAQCLCYDSSSNYVPSVFDNAAKFCYSYFSTATPSLAPTYSALLSFCTRYGASGGSTAASGVAGTTKSGSGTSTVTSVNSLALAGACISYASTVFSCSSTLTSFDNLQATAQASCLCTDTAGTNVASSVDAAALSCYSYLKTANTTLAPTWSSNFIDFCSKYGGSASLTGSSSKVNFGQSLVGLSGVGALPQATVSLS
ncbi:MAG: hypothetical protein M1829_003146 [Trizodia sp. TS-e1964]|nr:MAG: hypothetical protein M1829_003146 [Trizodia sp. TS-e1964]